MYTRRPLAILFVALAFVPACSNGVSSGGNTSDSTTGGGGTSGSSPTTSSSGVGHHTGTGGDGGGLGVSCSGASPTFSGEVAPIVQGCFGEGCHGWSYDQLVNVPVSRDTCDPNALIVVPGDLEKSYLMHKLTGIGMCPHTAQMPNTSGPLPPQNIQTIADWICQGAKND